MTQLAAIRPDDWNLPLFLHVLGALALIGTLAVAIALLIGAQRNRSVDTLRSALRSLTLGVIPSWIVLRGSAEWIADKEGWNEVDEPPAWIGIGYTATDLGLLLIVASSVLAWLSLRKARAGETGDSPLPRVAAGLITLLVVLNVVALWAMTTKPASASALPHSQRAC